MPPEEHFKSLSQGNSDLAALVKRLNQSRDELVRRIEDFRKLARGNFQTLSGSGRANRPAIERLGAQGPSTSERPTDAPGTQLDRQSGSRPIRRRPDRNSAGRISHDYAAKTRSLPAQDEQVRAQKDQLRQPEDMPGQYALAALGAIARSHSARLPGAAGAGRLFQFGGADGPISAGDLVRQGPTSSLRGAVASLQALQPGRDAPPGESASGPAGSRRSATSNPPVPKLQLLGYPKRQDSGHQQDDQMKKLRDLLQEDIAEALQSQEPLIPRWQ